MVSGRESLWWQVSALALALAGTMRAFDEPPGAAASQEAIEAAEFILAELRPLIDTLDGGGRARLAAVLGDARELADASPVVVPLHRPDRVRWRRDPTAQPGRGASHGIGR